MKRFVITLDDAAGNNHEAHLRMPAEIADRLDEGDMEVFIGAMFASSDIEVVHIEECEEVRHVMNRRWDDPKPNNE